MCSLSQRRPNLDQGASRYVEDILEQHIRQTEYRKQTTHVSATVMQPRVLLPNHIFISADPIYYLYSSSPSSLHRRNLHSHKRGSSPSSPLGYVSLFLSREQFSTFSLVNSRPMSHTQAKRLRQSTVVCSKQERNGRARNSDLRHK